MNRWLARLAASCTMMSRPAGAQVTNMVVPKGNVLQRLLHGLPDSVTVGRAGGALSFKRFARAGMAGIATGLALAAMYGLKLRCGPT